ncbi:hypothetical protein AYI87_14780 [Shewanella sp. KCT]|nr:hypothetical protein AYI87_14780 [Shewanella sp. KCT]
MWSVKRHTLIHREELLELILAEPEISGVSFLGGEPLEQADNLLWLLSKIRATSDLTTFVFTGFEENELEDLQYVDRLFELCDMLAVGRYEVQRRNTLQQWIGSDNQKIIYPKGSREFEPQKMVNQVELIIGDDASISILGFPDEVLVSALEK